jgi:hypothetical protein
VSKQHSVIAAQLLRQSANNDKAQKKMSSTISHQKKLSEMCHQERVSIIVTASSTESISTSTKANNFLMYGTISFKTTFSTKDGVQQKAVCAPNCAMHFYKIKKSS